MQYRNVPQVEKHCSKAQSRFRCRYIFVEPIQKGNGIVLFEWREAKRVF